MKLKNYLLASLALVLSLSSCNNEDDGIVSVPERDRAEQYAEDIVAIEEYLTTHFYNYEAFEADPNAVDFEIVFDTIAGVNSDKEPLMSRDELRFVTVNDGVSDVEYKLYYLDVRGGEGNLPSIADSTFVEYKGIELDGGEFDSSPNPTWIDLAASIQGYRDVSRLFSGASSDLIDNGDGTTSFQGFGIHAIFIPSGIGYFSTPPPTVSFYAPLIFTVNTYRVNDFTDHDQDGVPSYLEDIDGDDFVRNDDTDVNGVPNYVDGDDDGDGTLTINEVLFNDYTVDTNIGETDPVLAENEFIISRTDDNDDGIFDIRTVVLIDTNDNGVADYLDDTISEDVND